MSDQQRNQFETELATELARYYPAGAESLAASLKKMRDGDSYADQSVTGAGMAWAAKYAWWAWKQSRASCVVAAPHRYSEACAANSKESAAYNDAHDRFSAAVKAAGMKVAQ